MIGSPLKSALSLISLCLLRWAIPGPGEKQQLPLPAQGTIPAELHELLRWVSNKMRTHLLSQLKESHLLSWDGPQELQWLDRYFTLGKTDGMIREACTRGQLETAQWLVERVGTPKREECFSIILHCLEQELLAIVKWLVTLHDL